MEICADKFFNAAAHAAGHLLKELSTKTESPLGPMHSKMERLMGSDLETVFEFRPQDHHAARTKVK